MQASPPTLIVRGFVRLVLCALIFWIPAGRWDLPIAWVYWSLWAALYAVAIGMFMSSEALRSLAQERVKPGPGAIENRWVIYLVAFACTAGHWALAGCDVGRWHLSDTVPIWLRIVALLAVAAGASMSLWALVTNPFASSVVRIQEDRDHRVVTSGPYRIVRHPMYTGNILMLLVGGLALGSWLALLPIVVLLAFGVLRTVREDRHLRAHLEGYGDYARRVRWRLVPFVW